MGSGPDAVQQTLCSRNRFVLVPGLEDFSSGTGPVAVPSRSPLIEPIDLPHARLSNQSTCLSAVGRAQLPCGNSAAAGRAQLPRRRENALVLALVSPRLTRRVSPSWAVEVDWGVTIRSLEPDRLH